MDQPDTGIARGGMNPSEPTAPAVGLAAYILGIALLAVCGGSSLMLVLEHMVGLSLPGCGPGSACAQASESVWGKVPVIDWPVSFLGLAYFLGLLLTWLTLRGGVPATLRMLVRLGVLLSLGFVVVMVRGGYLCPYCLVTHVGNFTFWGLVELVARPARPSWRPLLGVAGVFVAASAVMGAVEWRASANRSRGGGGGVTGVGPGHSRCRHTGGRHSVPPPRTRARGSRYGMGHPRRRRWGSRAATGSARS